MEADDVRITATVRDDAKDWLKYESLLMNWDVGTVIERLVLFANRHGYADEVHPSAPSKRLVFEES